MYQAILTVKDDWFTYNVAIYKNEEKLMSYNYHSLSEAYKMIALFLPPCDKKETQ